MERKIGDLIASAIEFKDLKQKEVAKELNIQYSTFNNYVCNVREPDIQTLISIFNYLEIDINNAFNGHAEDKDYTINKEEAKLLVMYRSLAEKDKKGFLGICENIVTVLKEQ